MYCVCTFLTYTHTQFFLHSWDFLNSELSILLAKPFSIITSNEFGSKIPWIVFFFLEMHENLEWKFYFAKLVLHLFDKFSRKLFTKNNQKLIFSECKRLQTNLISFLLYPATNIFSVKIYALNNFDILFWDQAGAVYGTFECV